MPGSEDSGAAFDVHASKASVAPGSSDPGGQRRLPVVIALLAALFATTPAAQSPT
jgi:hypothetical protein